MKKLVPYLIIRPISLLLLLFLSACGQGPETPQGNAGAERTTPVGITLLSPQKNDLNQKQKVFATEALNTVQSIQVTVTSVNNIELATETVSVPPGESSVNLLLNVPLGSDRLFRVDIFDEKGKVVLFGSALTDLENIEPVNLQITLAKPITINPNNATLPTNIVEIFTATVYPGLRDSNIEWFVNDIPGGDLTNGTITPTGPSTAEYKSPKLIPLSESVEVKVTSLSSPDLYFDIADLSIANLRFVNREIGIDADNCGTTDAPCKTLARGIALAQSGDTILVAPGTYPFDLIEGSETSPLVLKAGVTLQGQSINGASTILDFINPRSSEGTDSGTGILGAEGASLNGFMIQDHGTFNRIIHSNEASFLISDNTFHQIFCFTQACINPAILVDGDSTPVISGNKFGDFELVGFETAIQVQGTATPLIIDNIFRDNDTGIQILGNATPLIQGNLIEGNRMGISAIESALPDLGGGALRSEGNNILSCNFDVDLFMGTSESIFAQNNQWDHDPPEVASLGNGTDIAFGETGASVNNTNASLYPFAQCNTGVQVTPSLNLNTSEAGGTTTFTVVLGTQPSSDVTISFFSSDTTEGKLSTNSLTFTPLNWNTAQTVTITGEDDFDDDGDQAYSVKFDPALSEDPNYNEAQPIDINLTNEDDESCLTLTLDTAGNGSGTALGGDCFNPGTQVNVSASPASGSTFTGWTGPDASECAGNSDSNSASVLMNNDKSCTANFRLNSQTLSLGTAGNGSGSVSGAGTYNFGTTVTITATPASGSSFTSWTGPDARECAGNSVLMNNDKSCTANFTLNSHTLSLGTAGNGSGSVSGAGTYNFGTTVTITATPASGSSFSGWTGPDARECTTSSVLMNNDKSCTANFTLNRQTLSLGTAGNGSGSVSGAGTYNFGTTVTITATPASGSSFSGWTGPDARECTTSSVLMDNDKSCTANFTLNQHTLTLSPVGPGFVTGFGIYNFGETATVSATPNIGASFSAWTGPDARECATGSVLMNADKACTATFISNNSTLTVGLAGGGTVISVPSGISCGTDCVEVYPNGTSVTLRTAISAGWAFVNWTGDCSGTSSLTTVVMDRDKSCTANLVRTLFLNVDFNSDDVLKPPNLDPPGDPVGDLLILNEASGTIRVQLNQTTGQQYLALDQVPGSGGLALRAQVAGTPPKTGRYVVRWDSAVMSRSIFFSSPVIRDSSGLILMNISYRPNNNMLDLNDSGAPGLPPWGFGLFQSFEVTVNMDRKEIEQILIDGQSIDATFPLPFKNTAASDLARFSLELGGSSAQSYALDRINIRAAP